MSGTLFDALLAIYFIMVRCYIKLVTGVESAQNNNIAKSRDYLPDM
jgi:hypothetical protein